MCTLVLGRLKQHGSILLDSALTKVRQWHDCSAMRTQHCRGALPRSDGSADWDASRFVRVYDGSSSHCADCGCQLSESALKLWIEHVPLSDMRYSYPIQDATKAEVHAKSGSSVLARHGALTKAVFALSSMVTTCRFGDFERTPLPDTKVTAKLGANDKWQRHILFIFIHNILLEERWKWKKMERK